MFFEIRGNERMLFVVLRDAKVSGRNGSIAVDTVKNSMMKVRFYSGRDYPWRHIEVRCRCNLPAG